MCLTSSRARGRSARRARAFTLIEMTIALLLAGIVLSALSSVILLGAKAVPDDQGTQSTAIFAADVLEKLSAEVAVAKQITSVGATGIEFTVADWTGDAADETVRYAWGGTAGDPILRDVNGSGAVALVPEAESFVLTRVQGSKDITVDASVNELGNQMVQELDVSSATYAWISSGQRFAQRIVPSLPADCSSWRIDEIEVPLWGTDYSSDLDSGIITLELRGVNKATLRPNADVYATSQYRTGSLSKSLLTAVRFTLRCPELPPDIDLCFVVRGNRGNSTAVAHWGTPFTSRGTRYSYWSTDSGSNWNTASSYVVDNEVYATVFTQSETRITRTTLSELRAEIVLGEGSREFERAIRLLNTPEVIP